MLRWALIFFVLAIIAGLLEMTVIAGTSLWIAKVLFIGFVIFLIISLISGRRSPAV